MFGRDKVAMLVAEFLTATALAMVILTVIARVNFPLYPAIAGGLTLGVFNYLFGSHGNPVVTLGLWTMRKVETLNAALVVAFQMLGGFVAWQLSQYIVNSQLNSIANAAFDWRVLAAEAAGAFVFGMAIATTVGRNDTAERRAVVTGAALTIGVLVASLASNALLNPAVALGVKSWSWAYAAGPILGGVAGMTVYGLLYGDTGNAVKAALARNRKTVVKKPAAKKKKPAARKRK
jgi:glycerol uptake facilitator-like aquaporin